MGEQTEQQKAGYAVELPIRVGNSDEAVERALSRLQGWETHTSKMLQGKKAPALKFPLGEDDSASSVSSTPSRQHTALVRFCRREESKQMSIQVLSCHSVLHTFEQLHDMVFEDTRPPCQRDVAPVTAIRAGFLNDGVASIHAFAQPSLVEPPPFFLPPLPPGGYAYKQKKYEGEGAVSERHKQSYSAESQVPFPNIHVIPFSSGDDVPDIPSGPAPSELAAEVVQVLQPLFAKRPVWHPELLDEMICLRVLQCFGSAHGSTDILAEKCYRAQCYTGSFAYIFRSGPFSRSWVRLGYDPRRTSASRRYQTLNANTSNKVTQELVQQKQGTREPLFVEVQRFMALPLVPPKEVVIGDILSGYVKAIMRSRPNNSTRCHELRGWFEKTQVTGMKKAVRLKFDELALEALPEKLYIQSLGYVGNGTGKTEDVHYEVPEETHWAVVAEEGNELDDDAQPADGKAIPVGEDEDEVHDFDGAEPLMQRAVKHKEAIAELKWAMNEKRSGQANMQYTKGKKRKRKGAAERDNGHGHELGCNYAVQAHGEANTRNEHMHTARRLGPGVAGDTEMGGAEEDEEFALLDADHDEDENEDNDDSDEEDDGGNG